MKTIELNLTHIHTVRALHIYMQYMLDLPPYYGRNLDALHDVLTEARILNLRIVTGKDTSPEMAAYLPRLARVLEDAARENESLSVEWI